MTIETDITNVEQAQEKSFISALEVLTPSNPNLADIEFELQPRSTGRRILTNFEDEKE